MTNRIRLGAYVVTLLTGAAGLVYQLAWQRYMARLLGSDSLATATVLGVFLGGLSLGYVVCGRLTVSVRRLLVAYAVLEGVIGLWALAFPGLFRLAETLTSGWGFAPRIEMLTQGTLCSVALLGVPTLCMGGTVPMLTRGLAGSLATATGVHARVYGLNTAGAFLGTLAAGFVLVPRVGLPGSVRLAALANLAAAVFFVVAGRAVTAVAPAADDEPEAVAHDAPGHRLAAWTVYAIALIAGFYFMTLETLMIRVTNLSIGASSYAFSIVVAAFLLAIAAGALTAGRARFRTASALATNLLAVCLALAALFLTLDKWPWAAHLLRIRFPGTAGGFAGYHLAVFGAVAAALLVPVGLMGATLPLAFDALKRDLRGVGRQAGALFAWNALGNLLGGLVGGYLLYRFLGIGEVFLLALGLAAVAALLAARPLARSRRLAAVAVAAGAVVFIVWPPAHDPLRFAVGTFRLRTALDYSHEGPEAFYRSYYEGRTVLAYRDDPEGTFAVVENPRLSEALRQRFPGLTRSIISVPSALGETAPRPRSIMVNGKADSSTWYDRETLRLAAHLPALLARKRDRVLVIGLGTGVTAGELALYPDVASIEVAEIAPGIVSLLPFFGEATGDVHLEPRLDVRVGDAFRIIRRERATWDLVISEPSNPWTTGVDQLFSREFLRAVRERLTDGGLFLHWTQRYSTTETITAIVVNTLRAEFPHVRVFRAGSDDLLLASLEPLTADDLSRAATAFAANPGVRDSLSGIGIDGVGALLARERPEVVLDAERLSGSGIETLDRPRIHYLAGRAFFRGDETTAR